MWSRAQKNNLYFLVGNGQMLDAVWYDDKFALVNNRFVIPKFHAQSSLDDEKSSSSVS